MKLVLKNTKLELKNKGLQEKLKQQETNALLTKIEAENGKMKKENEKMQAKMDEKVEQYMDKLEQLQKNMLQAKCDAEKENDKLKNDHKETEQKMGKLEEQLGKKLDEVKVLQAKCDASRNEHNEMKEKQDKLEEQLGKKLEKLDEEQKIFQEELEKKIMERIMNLQTKVDKLEIGHPQKKLQNNALEKDPKEKQMEMALLNFRQNYWDAKACQNHIQITELTVHCHNGNKGEFCTVFATHPILFDKKFTGIFYFEISIKKMHHSPYDLLSFGFTVKKQGILEGTNISYLNRGFFIINGLWSQPVDAFQENDIVGCGINSATRQIFFTKNGRHLGSLYFVDNSPNSVPDEMFPFVSFCDSDDEIEANFGPNFKFNLATL
ncbi:hypothetical protein niasHS_015565 [Heterodera schachtii]|uniref:B30.2/SPRY domain-containing protein n=1 Tax=Heterodera schachtii TaxID=97005 RepID=A0ABD2HWX5_HETSC